MSARKSWDIQPKRKKQPEPELVPVKVRRATRDPRLTRPKAPTSTGARAAAPLKERRRRGRRRLLLLSLVGTGILIAAVVYGLWQPQVRVEQVYARGIHAETLPDLARAALMGSYGYALPRDSIFFVPKEDIRARIREVYPDVSAVSVTRTGFNAITVATLARVTAFSWCGTSLASTTEAGACYETDAEGYLFAELLAPQQDSIGTTTREAVVPAVQASGLRVYAPLEAGTVTPLRAHIAGAARIPNALRLLRALKSLGADIDAFQIRDDEGDFLTTGGTRITYILGHEDAAASLAAAAFPQLSLNDGSIAYVDLRFDGKVYFKRQNEE